MTQPAQSDLNEFVGYLLHCTDDQVQGVYDKERLAYTALAVAEAERRGIILNR